jgi:hypothetical protein
MTQTKERTKGKSFATEVTKGHREKPRNKGRNTDNKAKRKPT